MHGSVQEGSTQGDPTRRELCTAGVAQARRILRLRPCRRPPWLQGTDGWLTAELGHFLLPKLSFWGP